MKAFTSKRCGLFLFYRTDIKGSMEIYHDALGIRHTRIGTPSPGTPDYVFLPGGPGADSSYFLDLIALLERPGQKILLDFPGNGSNGPPDFDAFDQWFDLLLPVLKNLKKPVLVGHSFGAMLPLLLPKIEPFLSGFIALNAIPYLSGQASTAIREKLNLKPFTEQEIFFNTPNKEIFTQCLLAQTPYHFIKKNHEKGRIFFNTLPFNFRGPLWWSKKMKAIDYNAQWIPNIPSLFLGGDQDPITPFSIFQGDRRFQKPLITLKEIRESSHWCWIDNPRATKEAFEEFFQKTHF